MEMGEEFSKADFAENVIRRVIQIGSVTTAEKEGRAYLAASVRIGEKRGMLWFSVPCEQREALAPGRSDAFVTALLPTAMRDGLDIEAQDPMSEQLHFHYHHTVIPILSGVRDVYHEIELFVPTTTQAVKNAGAVVTGYSGDSETMSVVRSHGADCEYPLTHIAVFNAGEFDGKESRRRFSEAVSAAERLAKKHSLKVIDVDTNLGELLLENYDEVKPFRISACALAIRGAASCFLFTTPFSFAEYRCDREELESAEPCLIHGEGTEDLKYYLVGPETVEFEAKACKRSEENRIVLGAPYLETSESGVRLCSDVTLHGKSETVWIEVSPENAKYLTDDRLDAFVLPFLPTAWAEGAEIVCEAPVSRRLLYQLKHYEIPAVAKHTAAFSEVCLTAEPTDDKLPFEGCVATGWTGGVDSMYTLMTMLKTTEPAYRLTHLLVYNCGTLESDHNEELLHFLAQRAQNGIGRETGLQLMWINSNLQEILNEPYIAVAVYRMGAMLLALQKKFRMYYHSSGYQFDVLAFDETHCAYHDMMTLQNICTDTTEFYSSGGTRSRIGKICELTGYETSYRYLHPCIYTTNSKNCGRCPKCIRTMTALYALGALQKYSEVFDTEEFEKNRDRYIADVVANRQNQHYGEVYSLLLQQNMITEKARVLASRIAATQAVVARNREMLLEKWREKQ